MTVRLAGTPNFRDLGGARTRDGSLVRYGSLFRSETVIDPGEADTQLLDEAGIVLVCDLRGPTERDQEPNHWWMRQGVELVEMDILTDIRGAADIWAALRADPTVPGAKSIMHAVYRDLPAAAAPHLRTIFQRIAEGDLPMLIHCTAGKDRTGIVSAMILHALGVSEPDILADYLSSAARMNEKVVAATRRLIVERAGDAIADATVAAMTGVDEEYLRRSVMAIEVEFDSIDGYLERAAGLDPPLQQAVRSRLLI